MSEDAAPARSAMTITRYGEPLAASSDADSYRRAIARQCRELHLAMESLIARRAEELGASLEGTRLYLLHDPATIARSAAA